MLDPNLANRRLRSIYLAHQMRSAYDDGDFERGDCYADALREHDPDGADALFESHQSYTT